MSIAKIIKICRRGLVTRRSVSAANKLTMKTMKAQRKQANEDKDRTPPTLFLFFIYCLSLTQKLGDQILFHQRATAYRVLLG